MRPLLYLALLGLAGALLLPLRGGLSPAPLWVGAQQPVLAREGTYRQRLAPGEMRTYLLELAAGGVLKVRFRGPGLGLRVEDAEGRTVEAAEAQPDGTRRVGVANSSGTLQTLYVTVSRPGLGHLHQPRPLPRDGRAGALAALGDGTYALELARAARP